MGQDRPVKPIRRVPRPQPQKPSQIEVTDDEEDTPKRIKNQDEAHIVVVALILLGSLNIILAAFSGIAAFQSGRTEPFGIAVALLESGFLLFGFSLVISRLYSR